MNYKWSDEKYSSSNKKYKWGKNEEGDYAIVQFRKYKQFNKKFTKRIKKFKELQKSDNNVKLLDVREKSEIKELIFTYELMNGYISLGDFIYQAFDKLTPSKIKFIGFHLARGLCFLQSNQLSHLRLLPSSIFIYPKPQDMKNNTKIVVRIGKYGFQSEKYTKFNQFIHPHVVEETIDPFQLKSSETFVYDAWSFATILYTLLKGTVPFVKKNGDYDIQKALRFCQGDINLYPVFHQNQFLNDIIFRCLNRTNNSKRFNNWEQICKEFQGSGFISNIELTPISDLFISHMRLLYLFSEIFLLVIRNIQTPLIEFWITEDRLKTFCWGLVHLCYQYHEIEFKKYFHTLLVVLPSKWKSYYSQITEFIENQRKKASEYRPENCGNLQANFQKFVESFSKILIALKLSINAIEKNEKEKSLCVLEEFVYELITCTSRIKEYIQKQDCHRQDGLTTIMHQSKVFKKMAEKDFGFIFPPQW